MQMSHQSGYCALDQNGFFHEGTMIIGSNWWLIVNHIDYVLMRNFINEQFFKMVCNCDLCYAMLYFVPY